MKKLLWFLFVGIFCAQPILIYNTFALIRLYKQPEVIVEEVKLIDQKEEVEETEIVNFQNAYPTLELSEYEIPSLDNSFKAYMDYRTITNTSSIQWELQQDATTDEKGFRKYNDAFMVAVGTYYSTECGRYLLVKLDNGTYLNCIVADIKQDIHTDANNQYSDVGNGTANILEFIVDTNILNEESLVAGDVSYSISELNGHIVNIYGVYEN